MRKTIITVAAAAMIGFAAPARADLPVIDLAALGEWSTYIPISEEQLATLISSYNTLANIFNTAETIDRDVMQVYAQAVNIYHTLQRLTDPNSYAQLLHSMHNPFPFVTTAAPDYFTGKTAPGGLPFGSVFAAANTVGQLPREAGFIASEIVRDVQAISSFQAVATNNLQSLETRAKQLPEIQNKLDTAETIKDTSDITARLVAEHNYASLQQAQAQNLLVAGQMRIAAREQRQLQAIYQHNLAQIAAACAEAAKSGMSAVVPACTSSRTGTTQ
jgi:hypothetical protein